MQNTTASANSSFSLTDGLPFRALLSMTPCFLFLYLNIVMMFTLRSKAIFCETPRYILFGGLLLSDSLQLAFTSVFYILYSSTFDEATLNIVSYVCFLLYLITRVTNNLLSPVFLALMSLERYVAICHPLRHAAIVNRSRTTVIVAVVWFMGLINWSADLTQNLVQSPASSCSDFIVSQTQLSYIISQSFTGAVFASVSVVVVYTYISVSVTARSATSDKASIRKARKTVVLHMIQLGLYLVSLLFGVLRRSLAMSGLNPVTLELIAYALFICLNILPRCLSPLIYGVRDKTFSAFFKYNFLFCVKNKVQPTVCEI
ncbi:odorant receptor 131-2-like [Sardina pilchardus]|uniref:odorant receptor 131-2-like n=1 Tax=Sardina pilchardus TaxID=27697 RepID=UPI002E161E2F